MTALSDKHPAPKARHYVAQAVRPGKASKKGTSTLPKASAQRSGALTKKLVTFVHTKARDPIGRNTVRPARPTF